MTNPTPHQPAPENVSKERELTPLDNDLILAGLLRVKATDPQFYASNLKDMARCITEYREVCDADLQRLNAQKDALIVELRDAAEKACLMFNEQDSTAKTQIAADDAIAVLNGLLAKTADSYAGKVVVDKDAISAVYKAANDLGNNMIRPQNLRPLRQAIALLDAPTANPENGKDGK